MHGGRGVCQWCARSSPVETRQNPRPRTTTTVTVNSNSNSSSIIIIIIIIIIIDKNNDVGGRSFVLGGYKNPVSNKNNNNKYVNGIVINGSIRRAGTVARYRRHCYRAVSSTLFRRVRASRRFSRDAVAVAGHG
ncbi:uncharacterized protein LOC115245403 [Formica exsecta]|uniref:uncharacterized protein LOC115245403 n=1 Tax=Formica exsecta TaxID=72781 RepID=UPI001143317C|nr:uncharacterized protein LOC115245403 [Formica exsecta]